MWDCDLDGDNKTIQVSTAQVHDEGAASHFLYCLPTAALKYGRLSGRAKNMKLPIALASLPIFAICSAMSALPALADDQNDAIGIMDEKGGLFMEEVIDPRVKKKKVAPVPIDLSRVNVNVSPQGQIIPLINNPGSALDGGMHPEGVTPYGSTTQVTRELLPGYPVQFFPTYPMYGGYGGYYPRPGLSFNIGRFSGWLGGTGYGAPYINPYTNPYTSPFANPYYGYNPVFSNPGAVFAPPGAPLSLFQSAPTQTGFWRPFKLGF